MRADARSLLDRLGRSDFAYKEFADRFSDLELWPLFEALLKDPRLFTQEIAAAADMAAGANEAVSSPAIAGARTAEPAPPPPPPAPLRAPQPSGAETLAELFNRYEAEASGTSPQRHAQDVRAMLRRLSELDARGEL